MEEPPHTADDAGAEEASDAPAAPRAVLGQRVAGATAWTVGSMGAIYTARVCSNIILARLLVPECWGVIAILRTFLVAVELLSNVGIRDSVVFHEKGTTKSFLNTAWTLQIGRGVAMWVASCALAWPVSTFYEEPLLLWLLPVAGLESINNGLLSVGMFSRQRTLKLRMPIVLDWIGLGVSIVTSVVWAWIHPTVWALAAGPLVGGVARTAASHLLMREVKLRPQWDTEAARALIHFGKWVYFGTAAAFFGQYFLTLYLGKFEGLALVGVYGIAWGLVSQAGKPLTMISNQVLIPLFAESGRIGQKEHAAQVDQALYRFLPSCLLIAVMMALVCPAFFGGLYKSEYSAAGTIGRFCAMVVWFMVLQHVPRGVMLSIGHSKGVCAMSAANAAVTVGATVLGYLFGAELGVGPIRGAILGSALGNATGCWVGVLMTRRLGLFVGRAMLGYSFSFLGFFLGGIALDAVLRILIADATPLTFHRATPVISSLLVTFLLTTPLALMLWRGTVKVWLDQRRSARLCSPTA